jgi:hypothetical protein
MSTNPTTRPRIGFVGLGHMGGNMAARLLAAGYEVHGEAQHRESVQDLVDQGLRWYDTPREVAAAVDVVFTSLPDDDVLESAASGSDGILAGLSTGKTWVDVSTVSPRVSRQLAERARGQGAAMLDAPVSGSVPQVQSGTLTIMVGGDEDAYRTVEPILRELGTPANRRQRPGSCPEARDQHQPRRPDARLLRRAAARRAGRGRPRARCGGDGRQPDRVADAEGARPAAARPAGRGLVRRRADAQGHPAGAGDG